MGSIICPRAPNIEIAIQKPIQIGLCSNDKKIVFTKYLNCDHVLCEECELKSYVAKACIFCTRDLSPEELKKVEQNLLKQCSVCTTVDPTTRLSMCGCYLCEVCLGKAKNSTRKLCSKCNKCVEIDIDLDSSKKVTIYSCDICTSELTRSDMLTLECEHYFCPECLGYYILQHLGEKRHEVVKGIKCPKCDTLLNDLMIQEVLSEEDFDKFNHIIISHIVTECPNCSKVFSSDVKKINCYYCKYYFCTDCKREGSNCTCKSEPEFVIPEGTAQCPGCKLPYFKDESCDHVKCGNESCGVEFCFCCSALRQPSLIHGNHYHRKQCKHFFEYSGDDDKYSPQCSACRKKGDLCSRPKNLKVPQRFSPGEE